MNQKLKNRLTESLMSLSLADRKILGLAIIGDIMEICEIENTIVVSSTGTVSRHPLASDSLKPAKCFLPSMCWKCLRGPN